MRDIKIGNHAIPVWSIAVILISGIGGTVGYYVWTTLTIPFEVKEPLEILNYPSHLNLYAGDTSEFNVTLMNHASANYSVTLLFQLSNATYQANYVTFSNDVYAVVPGVQNVTASVTVAPDAPPVSSSLNISILREALRSPQLKLNMDNLHVWYNTTSPGWAEAAFVLANTGYADAVLQSIVTRSQPSAWSNIYYWTTNTATINSLAMTSTPLTSSSRTAMINGTAVTLEAATGNITLRAGWTIVVYVMHPDNVGQNDVGTPVAVTVFTANAQWTQENNVQAVQ